MAARRCASRGPLPVVWQDTLVVERVVHSTAIAPVAAGDGRAVDVDGLEHSELRVLLGHPRETLVGSCSKPMAARQTHSGAGRAKRASLPPGLGGG